MNTKLVGLFAGISLCGALAVQPAAADFQTFSVAGSGSDGPLAASATFTTGAGFIDVTITNTLSASLIKSAGQAVSDLSFMISNAPGTNTGNTANSATFLTFPGGTTTATTSTGTPDRWLGAGGQGHFSIVGNTITLETIGGGQPSQMILPTGTNFPNANASIIGGGGHPGQFNRFVDGAASFALNLTGVTAGTSINPTSVTFSFGTGPDHFITVPGPVVGAGLPGLIVACVALFVLARRRRQQLVLG
jgi:hypothetical protein